MSINNYTFIVVPFNGVATTSKVTTTDNPAQAFSDFCANYLIKKFGPDYEEMEQASEAVDISTEYVTDTVTIARVIDENGDEDIITMVFTNS